MNIADLNAGDFLSLLTADPDIGLTIVSTEGEIISYTAHTPQLFGSNPNIDYRGKHLDEILFTEYAEDRLRLIQESVRENRVIKTRQFYRGHRVTSTIAPLDRCTEPPCATVLSRREPGKLADAVSESEYINTDTLCDVSAREWEVLLLLGHGYSVPRVAKLLHRSPRTIEKHKANIGRKLGSASIADIARVVGEYGLKLNHLKLKRIHAVKPEYRG